MLPMMAPLAQFLATEGIEGIRLQSYDDKTGDRLDVGEVAEGKASIAVGLIKYSDGSRVQPGDELTLQEAWDETYHYLDKVLAPALGRLITVNLPDHKLMAFASWLYNFGETKARGYSLPKLINRGADDRVIIEKWMEYINAGGKPELGLYRRRMAEVLMWLDLDWRPALNASFDDSVFDLIETLGGEVPPPLVDDILFDEDEVTADLNNQQLVKLKTKKVAITAVTPKVPMESYEYLSDEQKAEPKVKDVTKAQRGKAVGKKAISKTAGTAGVGTVVGVATGTAKPVLDMVDKYPTTTLLTVGLVLGGVAMVYHFWSEWQLQKGRDDADSLLG